VDGGPAKFWWLLSPGTTLSDGGIDTTQLQRVAIWSGLECGRGLGEDIGFEGSSIDPRSFLFVYLSAGDVVLWRRIE
jgi:hypothetical protein